MLREGVKARPILKKTCPLIPQLLKDAKQCSKCKEVKSRADFPNAPRRLDGKDSVCKTCKQQTSSAWAQKNREHLAAKARQRFAESPDVRRKALNRVKAHKAAVRGANIRDLTTAQWEAIKEIYGQCCAYCHKKKPLTMDHVIAVSKGGDHTASNIVPACHSCNSRKGARTPITELQQHLIC